MTKLVCANIITPKHYPDPGINVYVRESYLDLLKVKLARYDIMLTDLSKQETLPPCMAIIDYHTEKELRKLRVSLQSSGMAGDLHNTLLEGYAKSEKDLIKLPIIHITQYDLFNANISYTPQFIKYTDSSIWHYYLPLYDLLKCNTVKVNNIETLLHDIFNDIKYLENRYSFAVSNEFRDFSQRLLNNSYLAGQGHGQHVSPFVFHSEKQTKKRLLERLIKHNILNKDGEVNDVKPLSSQSKWRLLLLDDHANIPMRPNDIAKNEYLKLIEGISVINKREEIQPKSKLRIIIDDIYTVIPKDKIKIAWSYPDDSQLDKVWSINNRPDCTEAICNFDWRDTSNAIIDANISDTNEGDQINENDNIKYIDKFNIAITCVKDIKSAVELLRYAKYDIVLLDYLLDETKDSNGKITGRREYSYELLDRIYTERKLKSKEHIPIGPIGRLYFMHISAFSSAIAERLNEQGLLYNTKYWHIGRGTCPTNTPKLFMHYLISIMEKRYSEMTLDQSNNIKGNTVIHLLQILFKDGDRGVKNLANKHFNTLLTLRGKYDLMKNDVFKDEFANKNLLQRRGSLLVYSMFPDIQYYSNSFWEHLQHLVYLIAFGTIRQWPEMWEEYMFIRERIILAENELYKNKLFTDLDNRPSELIEQYIIHLKKA